MTTEVDAGVARDLSIRATMNVNARIYRREPDRSGRVPASNRHRESNLSRVRLPDADTPGATHVGQC